jgi:hypothetical protein
VNEVFIVAWGGAPADKAVYEGGLSQACKNLRAESVKGGQSAGEVKEGKTTAIGAPVLAFYFETAVRQANYVAFQYTSPNCV